LTPWGVQPFDDTIDKKLKKYKANAPLIKNYKQFIQELEIVNDPAEIGDKKHAQFKDCFGRHLTKSFSLIYSINYEENVVYLIDLDDHKNLYGRDNHS